MKREATGWAVLNRYGDIIPSTVGRTRVESIKRVTGEDGNWRPRWRKWKQWGSRCVKVRIVPDDTGGAGK